MQISGTSMVLHFLLVISNRVGFGTSSSAWLKKLSSAPVGITLNVIIMVGHASRTTGSAKRHTVEYEHHHLIGL